MSKRDDSHTFLISVAAELAGMHAQTLRTYDRLGLVSPRRSSGGGRRYSQRDVDLLREVQRLSQEGISLAGISRILELENQVEALRARVAELGAEVEASRAGVRPQSPRVFSVSTSGDVYAVRPGERPRLTSTSREVVRWRSL